MQAVKPLPAPYKLSTPLQRSANQQQYPPGGLPEPRSLCYIISSERYLEIGDQRKTEMDEKETLENCQHLIEDRVKNYWTRRAHDFGIVRKNELENQMSAKWLMEIEKYLPKRKALDILDVGTGTGYFAVLLAGRGHRLQGIDLTPAMLEEAAALAAERDLRIVFRQMDAQDLSYEKESFDVVISRNLTWTLPNPEEAYKEWFRVLRPGGVLLNFDANYGNHVRSESVQNVSVAADSPYGHIGMTNEMAKENEWITLSMDISREIRPAWDQRILTQIGFRSCNMDLNTGRRVLGDLDLKTAPMFGIWAVK